MLSHTTTQENKPFEVMSAKEEVVAECFNFVVAVFKILEGGLKCVTCPTC